MCTAHVTVHVPSFMTSPPPPPLRRFFYFNGPQMTAFFAALGYSTSFWTQAFTALNAGCSPYGSYSDTLPDPVFDICSYPGQTNKCSMCV